MFYIQFLDKQGNARLGSTHQAIFRDLKTLRGVQNRINKRFMWPEFSGYRVYKVADSSALYALDTDKQPPLLTIKF